MKKRLLAEWEKQDGVLIAWPDLHTDWVDILDEVEACYLEIAKAIAEYEKLLVITLKTEDLKRKFNENRINVSNVLFFELNYNDTWARDFGPITVKTSKEFEVLDFTFNGWGLKFASNFDNELTRRLFQKGIFKNSKLKTLNFVLEGGSIDTNGKGILLTTTNCLLSPNRNPEFTKKEIENNLKNYLGVDKIIWIQNGHLLGDDTDSHIDTIARFVNENTIVYVSPPEDQRDPHYDDFKKMEEEFNILSKNFNVFPLPFAKAIFDEDGNRLPSTYANFLIINEALLLPIYNDMERDDKAIGIIKEVFPDRKIIPINSIPLIKQHGSIHCVTMQLPQGILSI
ncbi:MAG: agmatine deiminase family protein [Brevinematales bacterium]|nr:agmatine deiminase family protein [Brevinematales bacterium]